ncbi:MAG: amino acid ABC transporter substrate-binding protein [Schwartzia sp.]|nr:amino acid ABC transporter substrate-binding protein [Schwartzia sp. (in: firmicutes)]
MKKFLSVMLAIICLLAVTGFSGGANQADGVLRQEASAEKVLRVGTASNDPPFAYYQAATDTHIGFDIELMQGLSREMGYDKVEFVNTDFNQLLPSLQEGKVDAVIACMTVTDERREAADFTASYLEGVRAVVVAPYGMEAGADAMKGKRIAVEAGSVHVNQAKQYSGTVIECGSVEEALKLVLDKQADFAVMDNYTACFFIANFYRDRLTLAADLSGGTESGIGIAVAKGNQEMLDKLNASLQNYRETAAYYQIKRSYFGRLEV